MIAWLDFIRGIVRPIVTVGAFAVVSGLALTGRVEATEYVALVGPIIAFWFAGRSGNGHPPIGG